MSAEAPIIDPETARKFPWWSEPSDGCFHAVEFADARRTGTLLSNGVVGIMLDLDEDLSRERESSILKRAGHELHVFHDGRVREIHASFVTERRVTFRKEPASRLPLRAPQETAMAMAR